MVHRAPDSRLLTNLIAHEKEYAKHLAALFPLSRSALASLSAYAAASPPHPTSPAQPIVAVVDALAGADEALQRYNQAVETWREQLVSLKDLEDDLTAILRDRDIFVTRLIKASKSTREAHRSSRLVAPLTGLGSVSLASLPSTISTTTASATGPAGTNAKLAQAQAELQACEAHLVAKERELDARRISLAHESLGTRCRALIDCGWVWSEMGKQGLKALQALGANGVASNAHNGKFSGLVQGSSLMALPGASGLMPPIPTYLSDNSSLTPSQSASQTAARSAETSVHEYLASKGHGHAPELEVELQIKSKPPTSPAQTPRAEEDGDLTITLPPAHAISELAVPTGVRLQTPQQNSDSTAPKRTTSNNNLVPTPRRRRTRRARRPPSQHITEVSDEGSDRPSSASHRNTTTNAIANSTVSRTTFPTVRAPPGAQDTSSDDDHPTGPLKIVENDPFEVIRRSMLSSSASALFLPAAPSSPSVRASTSDVRGEEIGPSRAAFPSSGSAPGLTPGSGSAKRERRTSMLFFGSIRGLFRKPKDRDRDRAMTEWEDGHTPPSPPSLSRATATKGNARVVGWVTRTDARIKGRGAREDSDSEVMPTSAANVGRRVSGTRLRKGRPGASQNGSIPPVPSRRTSAGVGVGMDGWITDSPAGAGASSGVGGASVGRGASVGQTTSRTRRGTVKRRKTSVADLRGSDQGHTDGEVDDREADSRRPLSLQPAPSKIPEVTVSVSAPRHEAEVDEQPDRASHPRDVSVDTINPDTGTHTNTSPGVQRATTTIATSNRRPSTNGASAPRHRRSASLSVVHTHLMSVATSVQEVHALIPTGRTSDWEPLFQPLAQSQTPSRTQTESQPKQSARRHVGNGHATHVHKHAPNQSLMSIVADVTRLKEHEDGNPSDQDQGWLDVAEPEMDRARSLDVPRAPRPVLRDADGARERKEPSVAGEINGRGHTRTASSPTGIDESGRVAQDQGQQGQRPVKMPLRSALRNASRTPSPSPVSTTIPSSALVTRQGAGRADTEPKKVEEDRGRQVVSPSLRDSASISSYETVKENLDVEEQGVLSPPEARSQSHSPPRRSPSYAPPARSPSPPPQSHTPPPPPLSFTFPPPPVDPPPASVTTQLNPSSNVPDQPSSNVSTEAPVVRRKSVRVSLQPTFSPTPPALCDDDGKEYAPWSESFSAQDEEDENGERERKRRSKERVKKKALKQGGSGDAEDMWVDSSEEDETYSRAKRLLSLVGKVDKVKKGKGKARAKT